MHLPDQSSQNGSSFFIILMGIFLFGALSFAVMQSSRTSMTNLTTEQARIAAQELAAYSETVAKAVHTLRLRGCRDTQINFAGLGGTNPTAPTDGACDVFSLTGGKVAAQIVDANYYFDDNAWSGQWRFTAEDDFTGVGSNGCTDNSCTDLAMFSMDLKPEICEAIERTLASSADIPEDSDVIGDTAFVGAYGASPNVVGDEPEGITLRGRSAGCLLRTSDNSHIFYRVLIAR